MYSAADASGTTATPPPSSGKTCGPCCLRAGRAIWYAPDQDYGRKQSLFVPLFGIQAATVTATTKFARLGRAKVVPFTQERLADGSGYRLVIHPPLEDFPGESEEADCLRINQWVEEAVSALPEQYLWAHRRLRPGRTASRGQEKEEAQGGVMRFPARAWRGCANATP